MKKNNLLLLLLLLCACNGSSVADLSNVEILNVSISNQTKEDEAGSFIERIEVVALETNDNCLIRSFRKLSYCEELDAYIILDKNLIVYIFSKDGRFISSSSIAHGEGPEQYVTIVDFNYNPYTETIDLLDPYGVIYCYDLSFNLIEKKKLLETDIVFNNLFPVDENKYLLAQSLVVEGDVVIYLADYTNGEIEEISQYTESLAPNHMMREPFFKLNDGFYFSPRCLDYYYYHINIENKLMRPVIKLDFGSDNIVKEDLIERFEKPISGEVTKNEYMEGVRRMKEIHDYLTESEFPLPIVRLLNEKYIYSHIIVNRKPFNFIYNRLTKEKFLQTEKTPIPMPFFVEIKNNILYTLIDPYDIEAYICEYMSDETLELIGKLEDDNNPLIMKYYLK